jgi:glycosyltransferase involved in cell wall biosynthesis
MLVSIVIANYNYAAFVDDAVRSALTQTHAGVEVIAVDDGSTDESRAVLQRRCADGVHVICQENRGHGGAFNTGYATARGDLVIFLDADDVLMPGAAAAAVAATGDERVVQVHWPVAEIDAAGRVTGEVTPVAALADGDLLAQLLGAGPLQWASSPTSGNAWTRRYLEAVMPIPEAEFRMGADAYVIGLAPLYGRLRAVERPHSYYRRHARNDSGRSFDEIIRFDLDIARKLFSHASRRAAALGHEVDPAQWEAGNWSFMLARSLAEIDSIVGADPFVLIDGMELSLEPGSGRSVIPFLEHDGEYWGQPEDDAEAISELERLRREGARFLVLAWPAFWWADAYPRFIEHVRGSYARALVNERLQIFDLSEDGPRPGQD